MGLDNSGKSTILNQIALMDATKSTFFNFSFSRSRRTNSSPEATVATLDFDIKQLSYKNFRLHFTDVGGQDTLRRFWRHHLTGIQGVMFVVDSSDEDRLEKSCAELYLLISDEQLRNIPLLIFANKQDVQGALSACEIQERFMAQLTKSVPLDKISNQLFFCEGSGITNIGVFEGLDWLCENSKPI